MGPTVLLQGTHGGRWATPGSPFRTHLQQRHNITCANRNDFWTLDVGGLLWYRAHTDWSSGGGFVREYMSFYGFRSAITHSYGGNVAMYAAKEGQEFDRLVTFAMPYRHDMRAVIEEALPRIGYWVNVTPKGGDVMQWLAQWFDGRWFGRTYIQPRADQNILIPGIGHTGALDDPAFFPVLDRENVFEFLKQPDDVIGARAL